MQLTEHFTLSEFVRSETAENKHIDNTPSQEVVESLRALCRNVLEPARMAFGEPIYITSGYRCPALNKAVGGKPTSQHLRGEAADLQVKGVRNLKRLYNAIKEHGVFDQLLYESNGTTKWIHVSYTSYGNRRQAIDNYKA
jgi:hypothetical protein